MRFASIAAAVSGLTLIVAGAVQGQGNSGEPFELVRSLQSLQDQVARGNARAHSYQRVLMGQIAERFSGMTPDRWKEPRNARAAIVFVLSGGNGRVLQQLLASGAKFDLDERLVKGALAYAEGQKDEAAKLLHAIDARSLDISIAGHVAFVQAELAAGKEPTKAMAYLDDARLLAPETLVEEAAFRRQITLVAAQGGTDRYQPLATQYMRRFPQSVYAGSFRHQFAVQIAANTDASQTERLAKLDATLSGLGPTERRDVYLTIAKVALDRGKVAMAKFSATKAAQLADPDSLEQTRSQLLLAASLVATEELDKGVEILAAINRGSLSSEDVALMDSALAVAGQVRRSVEPPSATDVAPPDLAEQGPPRPGASHAAGEVAAQAQKAIAQVDQMLAGANP